MFVIAARGQVKMTLWRNICFECRLTLKVIKLAIFFLFFFFFFCRNSQSSEFCKARIEELEMRGSLYSCSTSSQHCFTFLALFISLHKAHLQADSCAAEVIDNGVALLVCRGDQVRHSTREAFAVLRERAALILWHPHKVFWFWPKLFRGDVKKA